MRHVPGTPARAAQEQPAAVLARGPEHLDDRLDLPFVDAVEDGPALVEEAATERAHGWLLGMARPHMTVSCTASRLLSDASG